MRAYSNVWLAVVLSLLVTGAIAAGDLKVNVNEGEKAATDADQNIANLTISAELARIASDSKDAILMLAAAQLEAMAASEKVDREKTSEAGDAAETDVGSKPEKESLYALAEQYAGTNEALHAVIEVSKTSVPRGLRGGPRTTYDTVLAQSSDVYNITFNEGELAEIAVVGDGDTDLDLHVYDQYGNRICSDTDPSDRNYCSWIPSWTGDFRITVENHGRVYNNYRLATN